MIKTDTKVEETQGVETTPKKNNSNKQMEPRGKKFNVNSCTKYERRAFRFIQTQYPQYDVEKEFTTNLRILDSKLIKTGKKLGSYMTKFKQITMFVDRIKAATQYTMYARASAHLIPPVGFQIEDELYLTLVMVHEMTHAMQHAEGTTLNEVDTTRNEIEFLRQFEPELYLQLVPSQPKPLFRRLQRLQLADKSVVELTGVRFKTRPRKWLYHFIVEGEKTKVFEDVLSPEVINIFKPKKKLKEQVIG